MVFYAAFNSISVISRGQLTLFMLSWVSPVLGWALKCHAQGHSHEKTLPRKNPEDQVRLEPRTPGLRVKHFTTEPRIFVSLSAILAYTESYFSLSPFSRSFRPLQRCMVRVTNDNSARKLTEEKGLLSTFLEK